MKLKLAVAAIIISVAWFAHLPSANAQFRPCVWPNTCAR